MVMGMREKLIKILRVPIFPHELADFTEVVADYLLDNDVVPVVRCKDCKHWRHNENNMFGPDYGTCVECLMDTQMGFYCGYGERRTE